MPAKTTRQFGLWDSPITPAGLAEAKALERAQWDSDGNTLVWLEGRSGRGVLVAQSRGDDAPHDLTDQLNVRAEVGYGGGDFTVHGGFVYFVVHKTGRIYRQALSGGSATPITPAFGKASSPAVSPDGRWVAYVHHDDEAIDRIGIVDSAGAHWPQILTTGHDFYMQPRFSPDGALVAWVAWDHPNMPWDGTVLYLAPLKNHGDGPPGLGEARIIAGGPDTAVFQPEFTPDGKQLVFIADASGWGCINVYDLGSGTTRELEDSAEDVDYGTPAWRQDMRTYAITHNSRFALAARSQRGFHALHRIDLATGASTPVDALAPYSEIVQLAAAPESGRVVIVGSGPAIPPRIVEHDFSSDATRIVARATAEIIPAASLATCDAVSWTTARGEETHGLFYAPASDRFEGAGKPPLVALIHGGPTSQVRAGFKADAQFFATRGYAVLMVNYRGSTGYGREYMLKLRGNWGICDVEDTLSARQYLIDAGKVDPQRTVIMGGSAGGFTTLQTMAMHPQAFTAGVSLYGVADQFHLAAETHKFESRYLDTMLGPLPEASGVYRERSPVYHAEQIRRPLGVFQGDIDRVVPRAQSDAIVAALEKSGTPHVYHVYEGEGHGWRKRETIEHFYAAVDAFLRQHVLFA